LTRDTLGDRATPFRADVGIASPGGNDVDVIVSGAGASGLAATIALAKAGFSVACAGVSDTKPNGRTVALFEGSLRYLRAIGAWERLAADAQPISAIRIIDDTGARLTVPPLTLAASEIDLPALGNNIENDRLVAGLVAEAEALPNVRLTGSFLRAIHFADDHVEVADGAGQILRARLLVAADGRKSPARAAAKIASRTWSYPQVAITSLLSHRKPHGGFSTEFHTRGGPCTLVPLQGTPQHPHRSSLVWLMTPREGERRRALDDEHLALELQHQTRSIVGRITLESARGFFPMGGLKVNRLAGHRIVLMGEAAHAFPPLAAQGLNLSLRDIAQLLATLDDARARDTDIGSPAALVPYERARRRDIALRTSGVDVLNRSIMTDFGPVDAVRGAGAMALRMIGPLRRAVMREGILPPGPVMAPLHDARA
jgi:2-octaprenyl-6-methoxyphenol hydroxylase